MFDIFLNDFHLLSILTVFIINTVLFILVFISLCCFSSKIKKIIIYTLFLIVSLLSIIDLNLDINFITKFFEYLYSIILNR